MLDERKCISTTGSDLINIQTESMSLERSFGMEDISEQEKSSKLSFCLFEGAPPIPFPTTICLNIEMLVSLFAYANPPCNIIRFSALVKQSESIFWRIGVSKKFSVLIL